MSVSEVPARAPGVLPRYVDLAHRCREQVTENFVALFREFQQQLPDFLLQQAEQAESDVFQTHCMDVRQEIGDNREAMTERFYTELMQGFERFILGQTDTPSQDQPGDSRRRLSLVEKETFEVELAFDTIANSAWVNYSDSLTPLNHRLAVINGGVKPGERSANLPGSPHHVCNAFRQALSAVQIPIETAVKVSIIEAFDQQVLRRAGSIYQDYNRLLIEAGILPNLEDAPVYIPEQAPEPPPSEPPEPAADDAEAEEDSSTANEPPPQTHRPEADTTASSPPPHAPREEILEQELFQTISQLLARQRQQQHRPAPSRQAAPAMATDELVAALGQGEHATTVPENIAEASLTRIRQEFSTQLQQLAELIKTQHVDHTDADVIELVGMLFELVLNDPNLPDSVKALLSHLHTPYLKVALLDRKFFFKRRHPARRLLNLLTQAGALCNATARNEKVVFETMRQTVNRVLTEFDDNIELFDTLYEEFERFLREFQQKARQLEKRAIEKAKGQEKLREARQRVAKELVEIVQGKSLPKGAEKLLFGPWSNLLVLLFLRQGAESEQWRHYLDVAREIVWSVQPKQSIQERNELQRKLPQIQKDIQEGLALLGDPESNAEKFLNTLQGCHEVALAKHEMAHLPEVSTLPDPEEYPLLQELDPDKLSSTRKPPSPELEQAVTRLRRIKLGTWFEFTHEGKPPLRAKLSWFSLKTGYYIFVDQAGIQVAVKPLKKLAKEMLAGQARILEMEKKPFVERALQRIYRILDS
ncbi:hypothetical protein MIT9_P2116 [Methylomarinovum caldicuralii]|uniref:Thymidine phosphorylase n=1 Tax=Methylomarinovum caldicuralii TaxID=438856 RepID=A0AAU9C5K6_9GAMM|nr:DUF1631 domain-containing protein [Methylomarinovum caldicuralii]BCX82530.1 hypothetical protein MIT9_P2116 [Methylomarinovum caldicuralii]